MSEHSPQTRKILFYYHMQQIDTKCTGTNRCDDFSCHIRQNTMLHKKLHSYINRYTWEYYKCRMESLRTVLITYPSDPMQVIGHITRQSYTHHTKHRPKAKHFCRAPLYIKDIFQIISYERPKNNICK